MRSVSRRVPKVLLVDDDQSFIASLVDGLRASAKDIHVTGVCDGGEALALLQKEPYDLLVTDLYLPNLDGFGLLAKLLGLGIRIPVFIMTAFGTPQTFARARELGVLTCLDKPIDLDIFIKEVRRALFDTPSGVLNGISLASLIQLLQMERNTCALHVSEASREGLLYFSYGSLYHAEFAGQVGNEAVIEVLQWDHPSVELLQADALMEESVTESTQYLVLEAAKRQDDRRLEDASWRTRDRQRADSAAQTSLTTREPPKAERQTVAPPRPSRNAKKSDASALKPAAKRRSQPPSHGADKRPSQWPTADIPTDPMRPISEPFPTAPSLVPKPPVNPTESVLSSRPVIPPKQDLRREKIMANIKETLDKALQITGATGVALVDHESGMCLGTAGGGSMNLEIAAAGNTDVVRAKLRTMNSLGLRDTIEDMLITLSTQYHIIRPLATYPTIFLYLVLNRQQANLSLARMKLLDLEKTLEL